MDDVQEVVETVVPAQEGVPDPVTVEQEVAPPPPAASQPPAEQVGGQEQGDGVVEATAEEARRNNYVPYDSRFKPVLQERNELRGEVERLRQESETMRRQVFDSYREERYRPPQPEREPWEDVEEDPAATARRATEAALNEFRDEMDANRKAMDIRARIEQASSDIGFRNPGIAKSRLDKLVLGEVKNGNRNPDVEAIARDLRQEELDLERSIVAEYQGKKTSPAAKAARQVPPSPPVVPAAAKQELGGIGSKPAYRRVMDRLAGRG